MLSSFSWLLTFQGMTDAEVSVFQGDTPELR